MSMMSYIPGMVMWTLVGTLSSLVSMFTVSFNYIPGINNSPISGYVSTNGRRGKRNIDFRQCSVDYTARILGNSELLIGGAVEKVEKLQKESPSCFQSN